MAYLLLLFIYLLTYERRLTVVEADVSALKADVSVLKTDVSVLKTDVSVLKTDVSVLKTDVTALKANFVNGFMALFILISVGFAGSAVRLQQMGREMEATRRADRLFDQNVAKDNRTFDQNVVKGNRSVDRIFMLTITLVSLVGPFALKNLNLFI